MMKRIFAVLILVLLSLTSPNCFAAGNNLTGEAALDELYIWDFGTVKQGVELKHDFNLTNDSGKVLNIKNVNTSCGCTGSKADKNKLQAGESTRIEVIFKTKGYSGAIQQFVYVNTDNPDNPILRFTIKAEVVK